jgi:hypothetical protein
MAGETIRPRDSRHRAGSSAFALAAHGGLPPERDSGTARHRLAAVTPAERTHAGEWPSRRSSLEPIGWMARTGDAPATRS